MEFTAEDFDHLIETRGWDAAILHVALFTKHETIYLLCREYDSAYYTEDFYKTKDADYGLCFEIRELCIEHIRKILENS